MRNYESIINNGKLSIRTKLQQEDDVQIRAFYTDPITRKQYWCKFTRAYGWEHLTVSGKNKVPDWNVMCAVKDIFWEDEELCIQYHPKKSQYINNHENCLHIWRPLFTDLPEPDQFLIGIPGMDSNQTSSTINNFIHSLNKEETENLAKKFGIKISRQLRRG